MLTTLDHVVIAVADLEAATATYSALYGRSPSWRGRHPALGTANTLYRLENTYVELLAAEGSGAMSDSLRAHVESSGEGPLALAFGTADARAAADELRRRGLECGDPSEGEGRESSSGASRRWLSFHLPAKRTYGVPLLVIEHLDQADVLPAARCRPEGERAAVSGVDHVVLMIADAGVAIALYRDALGLRLALDRAFEERGLRLLFFRVGGVTVECALALGSRAAPDGDRFWGISYRVPDVAAARERLAQAGFDVSEVRKGMKPGTKVCTVRGETHGVATLLLARDEA